MNTFFDEHVKVFLSNPINSVVTFLKSWTGGNVKLNNALKALARLSDFVRPCHKLKSNNARSIMVEPEATKLLTDYSSMFARVGIIRRANVLDWCSEREIVQ